MKKIIGSIMALFVIVMLSSCLSNDELQTDNADELVTEQSERIFSPPVRNAIVQYGYADIIKDNDGPLFAYVRFPIAGTFADRDILAWANEIYTNSQNTIRDLRETDEAATGELNVQFNSYISNDRFAGVVLQGMFMHSALANPIEIVKTFNLDLENEMFLESADILDFSQMDNILSLLAKKTLDVRPDAERILGNMDESWLTHIAIGSEGIYVILKRAETLPSYIGTLEILLPYDELDFALLLNKEPESEPIPEPAPTPEPEPIAPSITPQSGDIDPARPMVALTFDDGPSKYTLRILELLERYGARATFFVIGNLVETKGNIVIQVSEAGNEILGHSWDHSDLRKLTSDEVRAQLLDTAAIIETVTGTRPHSFRPPYGAVNDTVKNVSRELGFGIINWSVDTLDWQSRNADAVFNIVMNDVTNRAIILNHDLYESTVDAIARIIPELISRGYQLVTISELLYHSSVSFEAGVVIYSGR